MWPIEFIKRMVLCMFRGEPSLPETFTHPARRNDTSTGDFSNLQGTSTVNRDIPRTSQIVQARRVAAPQACKNEISARSHTGRRRLLVGLPPSSSIPNARIVREQVSQDMTAEKLIERLAGRLDVDKDKWVILVFSDNKKPYLLDKGESIGKFLTSKTERLYFYPKAMVR